METTMHSTITLDARDEEIKARRAAGVLRRIKPGVGDWVIFADGVERRVSHVWDWPADAEGPAIYSIQTSDGGSWHMGEDGSVSFSGSLHAGVPGDTFSDAGELRLGGVWFFHHDYWTAGGGVDTQVDFWVWRCSLPANR
jgi:hypothetical protein